MKMKQIQSRDKPNIEPVDIVIYQQAEWVSWWLSNSALKVVSAPWARTVCKPFKVDARCVNTGDFAGKMNWVS